MSPATDAVARQAAIERAKEEAGLAESRAILLGVQTLCHLPPADLRLLIDAAEDAERMDWLERAVWDNTLCSNGIAIFPSIVCETREPRVALQDLGEEDGSNLGGEITGSHPSLRAAIDAARKG